MKILKPHFVISLLLVSLFIPCGRLQAAWRARVVHYSQTDIIPIRAKIRFSTLIVLPANEEILDFTTGDKDFWIINGVHNLCYVHPAQANIKSNLNLITASGHVYSFLLTEISDQPNEQPDLKVFVVSKDESSVASVGGPVKYARASEVEAYKQEAEAAEAQAAAAIQQAQSHAQQKITAYRERYPAKLQFDYEYKSKATRPPFSLTAIYHDDKFTYIKSNAQEKPAIYEVKDGKPDLVNFDFENGVYIIPEIVDKGYLVVGKQKVGFKRRDRNIEREAVVDERILFRDALKRSLGEASLNDIQRALKSRIRSGEFVEIRHESGSHPGRWFTTAQMIAYERENLSTMASGQNQERPLVRPEKVPKLHKEMQRLNPAQQRAVNEILQSEDRITGLQGTAGAGKTTTLAAIRQAAEIEGYEVQGFAPTSRAARQLEDAGIASSTLQRFLVASQEKMSERPHLYVLDESSLASTKHVNQFLKRLVERDRVLLVGDIRQHQAVEAGRPFEQMQEASMRTARLEEIVRQRDPGLKEAVELLAQGKAKEAIDRLQSQDRVHEAPHSGERLKAIVQDYLKAPEKSLIVSPDNRSRSEINRLAHESLQAAGKVSEHERRVTVLVNRQELTGADRQWAARYETGDIIRYTRGSKQAGIKAGEYATVLWADIGPNTITARRENGEEITYDPRRLQGVNVYKEEERQFAEGDRIQFTAPFREERIANRELGYIEKIVGNGDLKLRLESGRVAEFNLHEHPHLDYGYAMTSYSSQGQTADRVIVHAPVNERGYPDLVNQRFAYVALSRARYDAQIYANDASSLGENLSREISKRVAVEIEPVRSQERSQHGPEQKKGAALEQTLA